MVADPINLSHTPPPHVFPGDSIIEQHRKWAERIDAVIARVAVAILDGDMKFTHACLCVCNGNVHNAVRNALHNYMREVDTLSPDPS